MRYRGPIVVLILIVVACTPPVRRLGSRFVASLRLAKPQPVTAAGGSIAASSTGRQVQDAVIGMLSHSPQVLVDEADQPAPTAVAAAAASGLAVRMIHARSDHPTFRVLGAHAVRVTIDRSLLATILNQAGRPDIAVPSSLDGMPLTIRSPRAVRVQYGNCPAGAANTIQGQLQGTPPPTAENGNCVVLTQSPSADVVAPPSLALDDLTAIGLELTGMSPNQLRAVQRIVDARSAMMVSLPRGIRAYDTLSVRQAPAMLITTAGRRGPTYAVLWRSDNMTYVLAGYGNSADAAALAASVN